MKLTKALLSIVFLGLPSLSQATLLQILHTNDLHSHFDQAEDRSLAGLEAPHRPMGGYAQVKALIDKLKAEGAAQGMESLVLDAGDFTEGTEFFLADRGEESWRIMNSMGYDAVAMGNHDYLMGLEDLDRIIGHVQPTFPVLGANFLVSPFYANISRHLSPYVELQKAGVKIGIIGLTTDDFVYKWRAGAHTIIAPQKALTDYLGTLNRRDDFVILLTHLGLDADQALIKKNAGVDLVVGGHTHTFLRQAVIQRDRVGNLVPIVQAGQHGQVVGRLIVDVKRGEPLVIKSYELVDVQNDAAQDPQVAQIIQKSEQDLNDEFGDSWLHEMVGFSDVPLLRPDYGPTVWGSLVADAMKNAVSADLSIDAGPQLFGDNQPGGLITRSKMFRFYPRIFGFQEKDGWTLWTLSVRGWALRTIMEISMDEGIVFNVSGATYDPVKRDGLWHLDNFKIDGKRLSDFRHYRVAVPEGLGRAIKEISPVFQLWMHRPFDTGLPIWSVIQDELGRRGGVVHAAAPDSALR